MTLKIAQSHKKYHERAKPVLNMQIVFITIVCKLCLWTVFANFHFYNTKTALQELTEVCHDDATEGCADTSDQFRWWSKCSNSCGEPGEPRDNKFCHLAWQNTPCSVLIILLITVLFSANIYMPTLLYLCSIFSNSTSTHLVWLPRDQMLLPMMMYHPIKFGSKRISSSVYSKSCLQQTIWQRDTCYLGHFCLA